MEDRGPAGRVLPAAALLVLFLGAGADRAFGDLTVFVAGSGPTARATGGAALGLSLRPVGLEFEYAGLVTDRTGRRPAVRTGLFNLLVGAPLRAGRRIQVYGSIGGGAYRKRLDEHAQTNLALSGGGGVQIHLAGPFRVRVDYRLFVLRGDGAHDRRRRAYAGLNIAF